MSNEQQHEHPGPEWVEWVNKDGSRGSFWNPGLNPTGHEDGVVTWSNQSRFCTRAAAIERCRAISAAALAWKHQMDFGIEDRLERIEQMLSAIEMSVRGKA